MSEGEQKVKRVGVVAHGEKPEAARTVAVLEKSLQSEGVEVLLDSSTSQLLARSSKAPPLAELVEQIELLVVLGGDGTLLHALDEMGRRAVPLFGINIGSLGFLTTTSSQDLEGTAKVISEKKYILSPRSLLEVQVETDAGILAPWQRALNDVVVARGHGSRTIRLDVSIDDQFFNHFSADGIIVASPTGSTAYSLSAGGPIIDPEAEVLVITPICPHTLTNRSTVVSDSSVLSISACRSRDPVILSVDGHGMIDIPLEAVVKVRKSSETLSLAMLPGHSYYRVLQQKLRWVGSNV